MTRFKFDPLESQVSSRNQFIVKMSFWRDWWERFYCDGESEKGKREELKGSDENSDGLCHHVKTDINKWQTRRWRYKRIETEVS